MKTADGTNRPPASRTPHRAPHRVPASRKSSGAGRRAGFTLIELMVSAALMGIILVSGYLCLRSGLATQQLVERRGEMLQSARIALNLMAADLRAACPLSKDVQFAGLDRTLDGMEADNVDFGTHHYRPQRVGEGDFCQMSYFVTRVPETATYALWRRRNPRFGVNPLAGGRREELVRGVRGLKLEYYDGLDWHDEWGDPNGRNKAQFSNREKKQRTLTGLPDAVRITLWIGQDSAKPAPGRSANAANRNGGATDGGGADAGVETGEPPLKFQTIARLQLAERASGGEGGNSTSNGKEGQDGQDPGAEGAKPGNGGVR